MVYLTRVTFLETAQNVNLFQKIMSISFVMFSFLFIDKTEAYAVHVKLL